MEIFQLMHDFYLDSKFTDLTIVTGQDQLFCHSLILVSAVPGLRDILRDQSESQDDRTTLVCPDIPGPVLKDVVSDIYRSLIQDEDVDSDRINYWSDTLGIQRQEFFKYSTKSISKINNENDNSTNVAKRKRKRVVVLDDDDVEEDSDYEVSVSKSKQQKKTNSTKRKSGRRIAVNASEKAQQKIKGEHQSTNEQQQIRIKEEIDDLDNYSAGFVHDDEDDEDEDYRGNGVSGGEHDDNDENGGGGDEPYSDEEDERKQIMMNVVQRLDPQLTDKSDLCLKEEAPEAEELDMSELGLECPLLYDVSAIDVGEETFTDLSDLTDSVLHMRQENVGKVFQATTAGVYLRSGMKTHIPMKINQDHQDLDHQSIPVVPRSAFVALFAVGVSNGQNVAKPIALYHNSYPTNYIVHNFMNLIKQLTGISSRSILESRRHQSYKILNKEKRVEKIHARVKNMNPGERDFISAENETYHQEQDQKFTRLQTTPLPEKEHVLKFQLVNYLENESVIDYLLVHGDNINSLVVQSFVKPEKITSGILAQTSVLIDAMAAFCRIKTTEELHKVTTFKNLIENHYDRVCETVALSVLRNKKKPSECATKVLASIGVKGRRRLVSCPECRTLFPLGTRADKKKFEAHKLTHVGCNCDISFVSDAQYRSHMKSVHLQKKKFKCAFGSCSQYFSSQSALEKHYHSIHEKSLEDGVGVICAICGQTFVNQHYLKAHHLCYHKEFPCALCGEMIYGKNAQEKHHRDIHATFDDHLCQHCGKGFKMKKYLHIHIINAHTPKQDKPFPCHLCEKGFNNHMKLTQHLDGVHYKRKPYKCRAGGDVCNMAFSAQSTRKRHEKVAHKLDIRLPQGRKSTSKVVQGSEPETKIL